MRSPVRHWLARTDRFWAAVLGLAGGRRPFPADTTRRPVRLALEPVEERVTPTGRPLPHPFVFAGVGAGAPPRVIAYAADTGQQVFERTPFHPAFAGGVRVAAGDVNRDGYPDLIAAAGPGGGPHVRVLDGKTGDPVAGPLGSFFAYGPGFTGGVFVAGGDVDGDGWADVITAAGKGGGPHVKAFSGATGQLLTQFFAFAPEFHGGATVAAADVTGDGKADLAVGAGPGGGPHVKVFDVTTGKTIPGPLGSFLAFDKGFAGGVDVGTDWKTGDVTGDGVPDLVVGRGTGGGSRVKVFDGATGQLHAEFAPFGNGMTAGVRVATAFVTDDAYADVVVGTGAGGPGTVKVFDGKTFAELPAPMSPYTPFGAGFDGGLFVAASNDPPVDPVYINFGGYSQNPVPAKTPFTISVIVSDANSSNGYQTPTGTVTFTRVGVGVLGTATVEPNGTGAGKATLTVPAGTLPAGYYGNQGYGQSWLTFAYSGDANFGSNSYYGAPLTILPSGDLDIIDSKAAVVDEDKEELPGGWVAANNDNDNYNFDGDQAKSLVQRYDKDESSKVSRENDLVRIWAHDLDGTFGLGSYSLVWGSTNIRVWRTADKDGQVFSGTGVPTTGEYYWVEGLGLSSKMAAEMIELRWLSWVNGVQVHQTLDQVKFTVYEVVGAMNVPGYSKHLYQARTPGDSGFQPVFVSATNGTLAAGAFGGGGATPLFTRATALWGAGAFLGEYRVSPDASVPNFYVDREVNVVKVEITAAAGAGNKLSYINDIVGVNAPFQSGVNLGIIASSNNDGIQPPAMAAHFTVTKIEGPSVDGKMRGVRFIQMGMIQNGKWSKLNSVHNSIGTRRVSSLEGVGYLLDTWQDYAGPWYKNDPVVLPAAGAYFSNETDPNAGAPIVNVTFEVDDSPNLYATDTFVSISSNEMLTDFNLYFSVRTMESLLGSDAVYTQRAKAHWYFDGSGTYIGNVWSRSITAKTSGDKSFMEVMTGEVVPVTTGANCNSKLPGQVWTPYNL